MKYAVLLMLALAAPASAAPASAAPVHVSLKASIGVSPVAAGFVTLAQVADLSGGTKAERLRMASVPVGRVPLSGDTRLLTPGDIALKMRQAGFHPERDIVLEGAKQVSVVGGSDPAPALSAAAVAAPAAPLSADTSLAALPVRETKPAAPEIVVHRGDSITILVQQGELTITAKGMARDGGAAGQTIRVHRDGASADISATVLDAQNVQLDL